MSTRTYNRVILVVNTSKNLLLLFPLLFIKCNNFYMHAHPFWKSANVEKTNVFK